MLGEPVHGGGVFSYPPWHYPFPAAVAAALGVPDLTRLHEEHEYARLTVGMDQETVWHARFYDGGYEEHVEALYRRFLSEFLLPQLPEPCLWQARPSLRVHLPGNVGVGEFHRDGDYQHPAGEVNFILPLTLMRETASVWIESAPGRADYRPVPLAPGQVFVCNTQALRHGNMPNETGLTRVSLDFRVLPVRLAPKEAGASVNRGLRFRPGGYYAETISPDTGGQPDNPHHHHVPAVGDFAALSLPGLELLREEMPDPKDYTLLAA